MAKIVGNLIQFVSYVTKEQYASLKKLSKKTRVPIAAYVREGIAHVLRKYR